MTEAAQPFLLKYRSSLKIMPSFDLRQGEKWIVSGKTGAGKTTWLRDLVLLRHDSDAVIEFRGRRVDASWIQEYRSHVQWLSQSGYRSWMTVQDHLRVVANLSVFSLRANFNKDRYLERCREGLKSLGKVHLWDEERKLNEFSGGELQCLAWVRAVGLEPDVLLLDEATSAMDLELKLLAEHWLEKNYAGAWIWVSHDTDQIQRLQKTGAQGIEIK